MWDIFISYRRKDAEAVGYLLYKDLTDKGFSVVYDHKSLGGGNFREEIVRQIGDSKNVIVILSASSFEDKIFDPQDVYRLEIETALCLRKRTVGIMLENFQRFPDTLPKSIDSLRNTNCLRLFMSYYDEMLTRLVSGRFLTIMPACQKENDSDIAIHKSIPEELTSLAKQPLQERNQSVQTLLRIMESFNNSKECMRLYQYIDLYDRQRGVREISSYQGFLPTDLVTYLAFFETLYIIVASGTIQLSVIDYAYRFRFFAGCNLPLMQESELLPLGYQYPNILSFYNMWSNYIVSKYNKEQKCENISDLIPLYEYDLHKRYAAFCFANNVFVPIKIRFLNRRLNWLVLTLRLLSLQELDQSMTFQEEIISELALQNKKHLFEPLKRAEMKSALENECCFGLFKKENHLSAQINLLLNPGDEENLALDLQDKEKFDNSAIIDYVAVSRDVRGYLLQKTEASGMIVGTYAA